MTTSSITVEKRNSFLLVVYYCTSRLDKDGLTLRGILIYVYLLEMSRRSAVAVAPGPGRYHGFSAMKLPLGSPEAFQLDIKF